MFEAPVWDYGICVGVGGGFQMSRGQIVIGILYRNGTKVSDLTGRESTPSQLHHIITNKLIISLFFNKKYNKNIIY